MNSSFSVTSFSFSTFPGDLCVVKEGGMNESLSFPLPLYIVLPFSLSAAVLADHMPAGFLLSPGEVLPGLAHMLIPQNGVLGCRIEVTGDVARALEGAAVVAGLS